MARGGNAIGELVIKFTSDIADILTNTEKVKKDIEGFGNTVTKQINDAKATIKTLATAYGVFETIKHTVVSSVEAFAEVEAAQIRLQATLDATGNKAQTSVARIKSFADELSASTTFSDDEIINAAANIAKYTQIQGESFERTLRDAANLAAITGGPLSEAANTLGRAMENAFAASRLRRVGLLTDAEVELQKALHEAGLEAERQEALFAAIELRSAGAAAAVGGQGLTSAYKQLSNAINNVQEDVGEYISKAVGLEDATRSVTAAIRELLESGDIAKWALQASLGFTILKETFVALGHGFAAVIATSVALFDALVILGKGAQGGAQQIAGALLIMSGNVEAGMASIRQGSDLINTIPKDFERLTADLKVAGTAWDGFWNDRYDSESEAIKKSLAELDKAGPEFAAKAKGLASNIGSAPTNSAGFTAQQQSVASMVASLDDVTPSANYAAQALGEAAEQSQNIGEGVDGVRSLGSALRDAEGPALSLADAMNKIHEDEVKADAAAVKLASSGIKALDDFDKKSKGFAGTIGELKSAFGNSENAAKALQKRADELGISVGTLINRIAAVQAAPQIAQSFSQQLKVLEDAHRTVLTNIESEATVRNAEIQSQIKEIQFLRDARIVGEQEFLRRRSELNVEAAQKDYDAEFAKQQDLIKKIGELQAAADRAPDKDKRLEVLGQVRAAQDQLTKSNADLYAKQIALDDATQEWGRNATIAAVKVGDEIRKLGDDFSRVIRDLDDMAEGQARMTAQIGLTREQVAGLSAEYEVARRVQDSLLELEKKYTEAVGPGRTLETALKPEVAQALKSYIEQLSRIGPTYAAAAKAAAEFNQRATEALNNQITAWQSVLDAAEGIFNSILDGGKNTFQQLATYIQTTLRKALFDLVAKQWIIPIIANISGGAVAGGLNDRVNTSLAQNPLARLFGYAPAEENIKGLATSAGRASIALTAFANQLPTVLVGAINRVVPADQFASALGDAQSTFERMASDTSSIADSSRAVITEAARSTTTSIAELTTSVSGFTGTLSTQVAAVGSTIEAGTAAAKSTLEATAKSAEDTFSSFSSDAQSVMASVASDVRTLAAAVLQGAQQAFAAAGSGNAFGASSLGGTIADSTRGILSDIASDNLAVTKNIAADISESTNNIIGNTTSFFQDTTGTMTDGFKSLTSSTTETFRGLTGATLNLFGGLGQTLVALFGSLGSSVSGALSGIAGGGGGGGGLLNSLFGGGGNQFLGSIATSVFGAGPFSAAIGAGFSAGLSTLGVAASAGASAVGGFTAVLGAAGAVIAPLIPVFALALPLIQGFFDRPHGPKDGGFASSGSFSVLPAGERYFTPNDADKQAADVVKGISTSIREANSLLGGHIKDLGVGFGYDIDKLGTAQSRVSAGVSIGGQTVFNQRDVGVGRSDQELQAGIETQAARAVLAAVQNSNLPTYLANILNTVTAETASKDQATSIIQTAEAAKTLVDTLSKALSPEQVARFNEALTQIDFSQALNPIKAVVTAGFAELAPAFTPILEAFQGTDEEITKFASTLVSIAVASEQFGEQFKKNVTEALSDATQETADKVAAFVTILTQFGTSIEGIGAGLENLDPASITAFIDALGGADQALQKIGYIYQNFTTSAQKVTNSSEQLTAGLNALGITTIPQTHEQFLQLLNSFDRTTEAGRTLYNAVAQFAPLFVAVAGTADQAAQALENQAQKGRDLYNQNFLTPQEQLHERQVVSSTNLYELTKAGTDANRVLHELGYTEMPLTVAGVKSLIAATVAKYGAESKEADAIFRCIPAVYDLIDSVNGFGQAAAANAVSVGSLVDAGRAAATSLLSSYKTLADSSTGDFGAKLALQIQLIKSSIDALPSNVRAGGGTLDQKTYFKQLTDASAEFRDQLQRFTTLSAQFDAAKAEQLVGLQEWYNEQLKIFGGQNAKRLAQLAQQKQALEALIPTTDEANIADLQARIKQINTSIASLGVNVPALDALKVLFDQKWKAIIDGTSDAGNGVGNALDNIVKQIREFIDNLLTSDLSVLTPVQKLAAAQEAYNRQLELAQGGNQEALQNITKYANDYLTQARDVFASSGAYVEIFNNVIGALDNLADTAHITTTSITDASATAANAAANAVAPPVTPTTASPVTAVVTDALSSISPTLSRLGGAFLRTAAVAESTAAAVNTASTASTESVAALGTSFDVVPTAVETTTAALNTLPSAVAATSSALNTLPVSMDNVAAASTNLSSVLTGTLSTFSSTAAAIAATGDVGAAPLAATDATAASLRSLYESSTQTTKGLTTTREALTATTDAYAAATAAAASSATLSTSTTSSLQASIAALYSAPAGIASATSAIEAIVGPLAATAAESKDVAATVGNVAAAVGSLAAPSDSAAEGTADLSAAVSRLLGIFSSSATAIATGAESTVTPLSDIGGALERLRSAAASTLDVTSDSADAISALPTSLLPLAGTVSGVLSGVQSTVRSAIESATPTVPSDLAATKSTYDSLASTGIAVGSSLAAVRAALAILGSTSDVARVQLAANAATAAAAATTGSAYATSLETARAALSAIAPAAADGASQLSKAPAALENVAAAGSVLSKTVVEVVGAILAAATTAVRGAEAVEVPTGPATALQSILRGVATVLSDAAASNSAEATTTASALGSAATALVALQSAAGNVIPVLASVAPPLNSTASGISDVETSVTRLRSVMVLASGALANGTASVKTLDDVAARVRLLQEVAVSTAASAANAANTAASVTAPLTAANAAFSALPNSIAAAQSAVSSLPSTLTDTASGSDELADAVARLLGAFSSVATAVATGTGSLSAPLATIGETLGTLEGSARSASNAAGLVSTALGAVPGSLTPVTAAVAGIAGPLASRVREALQTAIASTNSAPTEPPEAVLEMASALGRLSAASVDAQSSTAILQTRLSNYARLSQESTDRLNADAAAATQRQTAQANSILGTAVASAPILQPPSQTGQVQSSDVLQLREALMLKLSEQTRIIAESVLAGAQQARTDSQRELESDRATALMLIEGFQTASKPK